MRQVDQVLADPQLVQLVYEVLAHRWTHSLTRGRKGTPAEVVLRLLLLKHMRNWSYAVLEREVRANVVYRHFTRVGAGKVPDAKTLGKLGVALGPAWSSRSIGASWPSRRSTKIVQGRRMRVDTTVVETNIHYPTDGSLLGDGVRVLTRTMKKIGGCRCGRREAARSHEEHAALPGATSAAPAAASAPIRARSGCASATHGCWPSPAGQSARPSASCARCKTASRPARALSRRRPSKRSGDYLQTMIPRVQQVMRQTRERLFQGNTRSPGKLVSLFEPHTEIIRKGKASKPTEFGKMVKIQEAEQQIVTHYEVYDERPSDTDLLVPAIDVHQQQFGRPPRLVTADAGFFSLRNEVVARERGVKRVAIPNLGTKSAERSKLHKKRWFRSARSGAPGARDASACSSAATA